MREPLLFPCLLIAGGIVLGQAFELGRWETAWPAVAFAILSLLLAQWSSQAKLWQVRLWVRRATLGLCLLFAGAFLVAAHRQSRVPVLVDGDVGGGSSGSVLDAADRDPKATVLATGCVVEPTVFANDRARFVLELAPGARAQVSVPAYANRPDPPVLRYGQRVEIEARFREPHNFNNPGAFDYQAYLARRDVFWTALVPSKGSVRLIEGDCGAGFLQRMKGRVMGAVFALRTWAFDRIEDLYPDNDYAAAMLEATLIGESANLERVWTESFRRSGTYHALVISGLHVSVLAAVLLALLRWLPISRNSSLVVTALAAWTYALVSGFTAPVARAAAGFTLYLIARMLFRKLRPLNALAAVAILYLAWDPLQLFEASFQLSFLSIAAIGAFAAPFLEKTIAPLAWGSRNLNTVEMDMHLEPRVAQWRIELRLVAETIALWTPIPLRIATPALGLASRLLCFALELMVISASVQVGLALPMAEYFHRISFTGLSANLLIVPLMNLVVPVGFAALFTKSSWLAAVADRLLYWSASIAEWHAVREPAWRVPDPPLWLALALVATIVLGAVLMRRNWLRWPAMSAVVALIALMIASPWATALDPGELELTAIDVGQGDSLLLTFPRGTTMLIDGGGRLEYGVQRRPSNLEIGEDVVSPYLWTRGLKHLDVIAATHAHQDHIGGLRALIENFHPAELWTGANPSPELVDFARSEGVRVVECRAAATGSGAFEFAGTQLEVLAPTADYVPVSSPARNPSNASNNDSLVLRIRYGRRTLLLMGDLERAEEQHLLESGRDLSADVLKVGHHGSRTSTTPAFLDAVSPQIAMISAGFENSFGHPHPDVMARLNARHATILRTDLDGLATVRTDGQSLSYSIQSWQGRPKLLELPVHLIH